MNAIINKFLLAGDEFMPKMHLRQPFTKNKERIKEFKQENKDIFIKMNQVKLVFNMIWLMETLKI